MSAHLLPNDVAVRPAAVPPLRVEIGVVRAFGLTDIGTNGLISGWSAPETAHNWNDGPEAVMAIATRRPDFPCTLVLEGAPLLGGPLRHQDMAVFAGGLRLGFWRLRPGSVAPGASHVLEVPVPPTAWRTQADDIGGLSQPGDTGGLRLHFHLPGSMRLSELQPDGDDRELGFCFRTLALFPAAHG